MQREPDKPIFITRMMPEYGIPSLGRRGLGLSVVNNRLSLEISDIDMT